MMSYDNYNRGRQHLRHRKQQEHFIVALRFTVNNQRIGVDYATRVGFLNFPLITKRADKSEIKMKMMI